MEYEPKEGVDYLVDLYAVAGVEPEATTDELKKSLRERAKEYHPDRLEGVAPEFQSKGERMAVLLNRARHILLDDDRRSEYDQILDEWDGPISTDGTPAITMERHLQMQVADKTPEEIDALFEEQATKIDGMTGYSPNRLAFLEDLIEKSEGEVDDALRAEYEDALLQRDRSLAIKESERSRLLGLPDIGDDKYVASLDYGEKIGGRIKEAREEQVEQLRVLALGGVSGRLALLAGETPEPQPEIVPAGSAVELPAYYDEQAAAVEEIAKERESIAKRRLANFFPDYPEEGLQTEIKEDLVIGVGSTWLGAKIDVDELRADVEGLPAEIQELLEQGDYKTVIERGFNVLTFDLLEQIDIQDQVLVAIEKHIEKYKNDDGTVQALD